VIHLALKEFIAIETVLAMQCGMYYMRITIKGYDRDTEEQIM
jgi:hypothetical protein